MKNEQHCQIWSLAGDRADYERFAYLLSKPSEDNGLSPELFNELLRERAVSNLSGAVSCTVIHDPCNIRKPLSKELENLDQVLDLEGKIVNGYRTFNSVLLHQNSLSLLGCRPYSQKEASTQGNEYLTNKEVSFNEIRLISETLKANFPDRVITHLFDREADDSAYFEFIDKNLKDFFVFRLKTNRNSDVHYWNEEKGKECPLKLHLKTFNNSFNFVIEKFTYRGKCYKQVNAEISYDKEYVGKDFYHIVRIQLKTPRGKAIFAKPMVLITNHDVRSSEVALEIFRKYLKRSKIEGVFKFLKQGLGWENFQIRNFQAIKNILSLAFFVGAYFCEREPELINNPWVNVICQLAKNKGKISKHFFMKGLLVLAHLSLAQQIFKELKLSKDDIQQVMKLLE